MTNAQDAFAEKLVRALNAQNYAATSVAQPSGDADVTLLTEGLTPADTATRHWSALDAARAARREGAQIILLQAARADTGLEGLSKTLRKEWPDVNTLCWTVPGIDLEQEASVITATLNTDLGDGDLQPGPVLRCASLGDRLAPRPVPMLTKDAVWLITGGARGITAACAAALATQAGGTFLLAGRSAAAPWPRDIPDTDDLAALRGHIATQAKSIGEKLSPLIINQRARAALAGREIRASLAGIHATGAQAVYLTMDASDPQSVRRAIQNAQATYGPITGLVHGAGVLADRLVMEKTEAELRSVFGPKVDGLKTLLAALELSALSHVALFSSAAAFFGNRGQADYAMANTILARTGQMLSEKLAHTRVKVFHWGPWAGGMVDAGLAAHFAAQNIPLIPIDEGARIFGCELLGGVREQVELVVGEVWATS